MKRFEFDDQDDAYWTKKAESSGGFDFDDILDAGSAPEPVETVETLREQFKAAIPNLDTRTTISSCHLLILSSPQLYKVQMLEFRQLNKGLLLNSQAQRCSQQIINANALQRPASRRHHPLKTSLCPLNNRSTMSA